MAVFFLFFQVPKSSFYCIETLFISTCALSLLDFDFLEFSNSKDNKVGRLNMMYFLELVSETSMVLNLDDSLEAVVARDLHVILTLHIHLLDSLQFFHQFLI